MLSLTRHDGQAVLIGPDIRVEVWETRKGRAVLHIEAPPDVKILREELAAKVAR